MPCFETAFHISQDKLLIRCLYRLLTVQANEMCQAAGCARRSCSCVLQDSAAPLRFLLDTGRSNIPATHSQPTNLRTLQLNNLLNFASVEIDHSMKRDLDREKAYERELKQAGFHYNIEQLLETLPSSTRVIYNGNEYDESQLDYLLAIADQAQGQSICLIENISRPWITALGVTWKIEQDFFLQYAGRSSVSFTELRRRANLVDQYNWKPWNLDPKNPEKPPSSDGIPSHFHMTGLLPFADASQVQAKERSHRPFRVDSDNADSATGSLNVSYCRVSGKEMCKSKDVESSMSSDLLTIRMQTSSWSILL